MSKKLNCFPFSYPCFIVGERYLCVVKASVCVRDGSISKSKDGAIKVFSIKELDIVGLKGVMCRILFYFKIIPKLSHGVAELYLFLRVYLLAFIKNSIFCGKKSVYMYGSWSYFCFYNSYSFLKRLNCLSRESSHDIYVNIFYSNFSSILNRFNNVVNLLRSVIFF